MGSVGIVVAPLLLDQDAGFIQGREHRFVRQFVPEPGVEALDDGVLLRRSRRDVVPFDPLFLRPAQDGHAGELGAVV